MTRIVINDSCLVDVCTYLLDKHGFELQSFDYGVQYKSTPAQHRLGRCASVDYLFNATADLHATIVLQANAGISAGRSLRSTLLMTAHEARAAELLLEDDMHRYIRTRVTSGDAVQINGTPSYKVLLRSNGINLRDILRCRIGDTRSYSLSTNELKVCATQPVELPVQCGHNSFDAYNPFQRVDLMRAAFSQLK